MNLRRDVFQAIADPTRRTILLLVASQAMTAGAIAAKFDTARPTVSMKLTPPRESSMRPPVKLPIMPLMLRAMVMPA